jgi:hypothetical protein
MKKNVPITGIGTNITNALHLIEHQEISNKISEYWELSDVIKNLGITIEELKFKPKEKYISIFDKK